MGKSVERVMIPQDEISTINRRVISRYIKITNRNVGSHSIDIAPSDTTTNGSNPFEVPPDFIKLPEQSRDVRVFDDSEYPSELPSSDGLLAAQTLEAPRPRPETSNVNEIIVNPPEIAVSGLTKLRGFARNAKSGLLSLKQKASDAYTVANIKLMTMGVKDEKSAIGPAEKKTSHKKLYLGLGSLAVLGLGVYAASKGFSSGTSHRNTQEALPLLPAAPKIPHAVHDSIPPLSTPIDTVPHEPVVRHLSKAGHAVTKIQETKETLKFHGDTMWNHMHDRLREKLGREPSNSMIARATNKALHFNHISPTDARHMNIGDSFKMPNKLI
jgi:hypothetical protein